MLTFYLNLITHEKLIRTYPTVFTTTKKYVDPYHKSYEKLREIQAQGLLHLYALNAWTLPIKPE